MPSIFDKKTYTNYSYNREDAMTKIIVIHIRNINETFLAYS